MDKNRDTLTAFYKKGLTVNSETTPAEVMGPILADDFVSHGSVESYGKSHLIEQVSFFWKLVPDLKWQPQELLTCGDQYVVRSKVTGTPNGNFMGLPTDGSRSFDIMTIDILKVVDGKIVQAHHLEDWGTAMKQVQA